MKNSAYGAPFAAYYDALGDNIDYAGFADYYENAFRKYAEADVKRVCEMACGSGSLSVVLAERGYLVTAFDLSEDMLSLAEQKTRKKRLSQITYSKQDLRDFAVYHPCDAAICMLDSLNCLADNASLCDTFAHTAKALVRHGLFAFDVGTRDLFENVYADNAYVMEAEGVLLAWQNAYHASTKNCDQYLTFFAEEADGRYVRREEHCRMHYFPEKTVEKYLKINGFSVLEKTYSQPFLPENDRVLYICRKED